MSDAERVAFEDHFITCAKCQHEVRLADTVRAGLAVMTPAVVRAGRPSHAWRWLGVGVALAAGLAAVVILRRGPEPAFVALGAVTEPPVYLGVPVRGTPGTADSIFDRAMTDYSARRYLEAITGLRAALAAGRDSIPTDFFLGASLLLSGDAEAAAATLDRVVAKGDTPYRDDAQMYEAKALLRLGRGRDALDVLTRHKPGDPVLASAFSALADSITRALGR